MEDTWPAQLEELGRYIRTQRNLARLSLREMAALTKVSNPYLSQIERGLHEPSVRVLKAIAEALDLSTETLLERAGLLADEPPRSPTDVPETECAIRADPRLSEDQKRAMLAVYRSYIGESTTET